MTCDKLKEKLQELHITQAALAERVGRDKGTVSRQLAGHNPLDPDVEEVARTMIREARAERYLRVGKELMDLASDALHRD